MESRRAKLIAEVIRYLEDLDGEELKGGMNPEVPGEMPPVGGDVAVLAEKPGEMPGMEPKVAEVGEDLDDDELDELSKLSS